MSIVVPPRQRHKTAVLVGLTLLCATAALCGAAIGPVPVTPAQVLTILLDKVGVPLPWTFEPQQAMVLYSIRLPRVCMGLAVGAGLALSGALLQGLFRNPLADPGLIGVSSGAALGAATLIILGGGIATAWGGLGTMLAAFGGGLTIVAVVYRLATRRACTSVTTMLLAGIALNSLCGAGTGLLLLISDDAGLRNFTFWMLGSLGGATWPSVTIVAAQVGLAALVAPRLARALNAMLLGETEAQHLGIQVQRVKYATVGLATLSVAAATAACGIVGFVGLVVPHVVRLATGPDHRTLVPASVLLGGALTMLADTLARVLIQPVEIPIGIITAFCGAPFFIVLLIRAGSHYQL